MGSDDFIFDYRLGYVRGGCAFPGFDKIGGDAAARRIITLGGYTTPEQVQGHLSWADSLHKLGGDRFQVLNGCTDGYSSAQIMTMFVREVLLFKPKLVICLSGFYNFAYKLGFVQNQQDAEFLKSHPFATPGHLTFYRKITARFGLGNDQVFYGEENHLPAWEYWLKQMEMIHCLCIEFGIRLLTFLQPCVFSGNYRRNERESGILQKQYGLSGPETERLHGEFQQEYRRAAEQGRRASYMADLSGLFDADSDVYLDACHVREEFTPRIAGSIYSRMRSEGFPG